MDLKDILEALDALPAKDRQEIERIALAETKDMLWVPNPGKQSEAYFCEADELFYGGSAGSGKTDLAVGTALTAHERSLILREFLDDARSMADRMLEIAGDRNGWNGQLLRYRKGKLSINFAGCRTDDDKQRFKGKPNDLIVFDEVGDFLESVYTFIIGWNRSATPGQRCRIIATGNPPTKPEGLWVIRRWAAWLDPQHPSPAESGELRYYTMLSSGEEIEVDGPGPHEIKGEPKPLVARSRTFMRARLEDNPDLVDSGYAATLDALPIEYRDAYRDGKFEAALRDDAFQCIPTAWIREAQARWKPQPPVGVPMCSMGVDIAQGGNDETAIAPRYDGWFSPLVTIPGKETPDGKTAAGFVVKHRRNNSHVVVDIGGGWGADAYAHLRENGVDAKSYMGLKDSHKRTLDKQHKFTNVRSEAYWQFREALDPSQPGGSPVALPPDPKLVSDLCAPTYEMSAQGIKLESKEKVCKRLGRSPDRGDAVVMAWWSGNKDFVVQPIRKSGSRKPKVNLGYANMKGRGR